MKRTWELALYYGGVLGWVEWNNDGRINQPTLQMARYRLR